MNFIFVLLILEFIQFYLLNDEFLIVQLYVWRINNHQNYIKFVLLSLFTLFTRVSIELNRTPHFIRLKKNRFEHVCVTDSRLRIDPLKLTKNDKSDKIFQNKNFNENFTRAKKESQTVPVYQ